MSNPPAGVGAAAREPYELFGELGRDETGRSVLLAKDRTSERLVALRLDGAETLTVLDTLDARVPAGPGTCPVCRHPAHDWRSFCTHCGTNMAGVSAAVAGVEQPRQVEEALHRTGDSVEVLGAMSRADGGAAVYFGRDRSTGSILALSLHVTTGSNTPFTVEKTTLTPAAATGGAHVVTGDARTGATPAEPGTAEPLGRYCPSCERHFGSAVRFCPHDGSVLRVLGQTDDLIGQVIADRYHVLEKIGHGGMGLVYLAEHVKMGRRCAIKVMHRNLSPDLSAVSRFGREAANASRINHPNIATIYDFGETKDHLVYLAMEYVPGEALARLLARETVLEPARAVSIAWQIADALDAAHRQSVVHRDLKPDNILVTHDRAGQDLVKVVDFGIAKAMLGDADGLTRTGAVVGTPRYMSPEQLIADPVDGRSDIYSLGCILYEMLVGERPFGDRAVDLPRRLTEPPPHPREGNRAIPAALDAIVVRALARKPEERYADAAQLRDALSGDFSVTAPSRNLMGFLGRIRNRPATTTPTAPAGPAARQAPTGGSRVPTAAPHVTPLPEVPVPPTRATPQPPFASPPPAARTAPTAAAPTPTPTPTPMPIPTPTPTPTPTAPGEAHGAAVQPGVLASDVRSIESGPVEVPATISTPTAGDAVPYSSGGEAREVASAAMAADGVFTTAGDFGAAIRRPQLRRLAVAAVIVLLFGGAGATALIVGGGPDVQEADPGDSGVVTVEGGGVPQPGPGAGPPAGGEPGSAGRGPGLIGGPPVDTARSTAARTGDATAVRGRTGGGPVMTTGDTATRVVETRPALLRIVGPLPPRATVRVNGQRVDAGSGTIELPAGRSSAVVVEAAGFVSQSWSGTVPAGEARDWTPQFRAEPPPPEQPTFTSSFVSAIGRFRALLQDRVVDCQRLRLDADPAACDELRRHVTDPGIRGLVVSATPVQTDSAELRAVFRLTISDTIPYARLLHRSNYRAEFGRTQNGWALVAVTRQ